MTIPFRMAVKVKGWVNVALGQLVCLSDNLLFRAEYYSSLPKRALQRVGRFLGDLACLLSDLPRLTAYRLKGAAWSIVYVGDRLGALDVQEVLFNRQEATLEEIGRFSAWDLPARSQQWLQSGDQLVICEQSRLCPWRPTARWSFSVPHSVTQILKIPATPEDLLAGRRMHGPRRRIKQAQQNGFDFRFSRSLPDLEFFYREMYLPFIQGRHGPKAEIMSFDEQNRSWFSKGGLILVTRHSQPVAGALCIRTADMVHGIQEGVLHNDPELIKQGANAIVVWSTLAWSHQQGAQYLNLGASRAWCENPIFDFKAAWGAQVRRCRRIYRNRLFLSQDLPMSLCQRLNQIRFLSEFDGKFYSLWLTKDETADLTALVGDEAGEAERHGLAGVAVVGPGRTTLLPASQVADGLSVESLP
jgi:hypothetical protein